MIVTVYSTTLRPIDAAEVVLYRCIQRIKDEKGKDTALEMTYEFLDDFEDPVEGGIRGFYNSTFETTPSHGTLGLRTLPEPAKWTDRKAPKYFDKNNHVLSWMVNNRLDAACKYYTNSTE